MISFVMFTESTLKGDTGSEIFGAVREVNRNIIKLHRQERLNRVAVEGWREHKARV